MLRILFITIMMSTMASWSLQGPCSYPSLSIQARRKSQVLCRGYFSDVDPNAEVRSVRRGREFNVKEREGFSDFIWNTDWQSHLDAEEEAKKNKNKTKEEKPQGFLSLSRTADLNNVDLDLSEELKPKPKIEGIDAEPRETTSKYIPPTPREESEWDRSTKFASRVVPLNTTEEEKMTAEEDMQNYNQENTELLLWTFALTGISFGASYVSYSQDVAVSYLVGSLGGILYLRLLKKGVEDVGGSGGGLSSLAAQPRLLIPVILVMAFNRWNTLAADVYGLHLELLPMLVGFFTYKAAVIGRQSTTVFSNFVKDLKKA